MKSFITKGVFLFPLLVSGAPLMAAGGDVLVPKIINTVIFFGGLGYLLRNVIADFFGNRVKTIRNDLEKAEKSREEANRRLAELDEKMKNLDSEVEDIRAQAQKEAEDLKKRILEQAEHDSQRIMEQATAEIDNMRREATANLKTYMADLAMDEAEKIIRETISEEEHAKLFADFTAQVGAKS